MGQFSKFCLRQPIFAFKVFCMEKKWSTIFEATNIMNLTYAILKSSYRDLQDPPWLIFCMIFEKNYISGYILLMDQVSCLAAFTL